MLLYLGAGLLIVAALYIQANIFWVGIGYLCIGFVWWSRYYIGRPPGQMPPVGRQLISIYTLTLILLWPLGALLRVYEHRHMLAYPDRFIVLYGHTGASKLVQTPFVVSLGSWDEAVALARSEAIKSGYPSSISDGAFYSKTPLLGPRDNVKYSVSPTGAIKREN